MGQALERAQAVQTLVDKVNKYAGRITAGASKYIDKGAFLSRATTLITDPKNQLDKCSWRSIVSCIIQMSQIGLVPDNILGQAYLVPFKGEATLIIGYKGMITLAHRAGINNIYADIIYENEVYDYQRGSNATLTHQPLPPEQRGKRKIAAYAVCTINGEKKFELLWASEVESIKAKARAKSMDSPWNTYEEEMWKKSAIRRVLKTAPTIVDGKDELQKAIALDERAEAGLSQRETFFFDDPDGDDTPIDVEGRVIEQKEVDPGLKERVKDSPLFTKKEQEEKNA